jgi:hypothetical protein
MTRTIIHEGGQDRQSGSVAFLSRTYSWNDALLLLEMKPGDDFIVYVVIFLHCGFSF